MASAAREHAIEVGRGVAGRTLIAIGGAASLHAADLAAKLQIDRVLVPVAAGVGSAAGFLRAPLAFEKSRSQHQLLSRYSPEIALAVMTGLLEEAGCNSSPVAQSAGSSTGSRRRCATADRATRSPCRLICDARRARTHLRAAFEPLPDLYGRVHREGYRGSRLDGTCGGASAAPGRAGELASTASPDTRNWWNRAGARVAGPFDRDALENGENVAGPGADHRYGHDIDGSERFTARHVCWTSAAATPLTLSVGGRGMNSPLRLPSRYSGAA